VNVPACVTNDAFLIVKPEAIATCMPALDEAIAREGFEVVAQRELDHWPTLARRIYAAARRQDPDLEAWLGFTAAMFPEFAERAVYRAVRRAGSGRLETAARLVAFKNALRSTIPLARDYSIRCSGSGRSLYFSLIHTPDADESSIEREIAIMRTVYDPL
jgi:nucleoside diphosphate kinase